MRSRTMPRPSEQKALAVPLHSAPPVALDEDLYSLFVRAVELA